MLKELEDVIRAILALIAAIFRSIKKPRNALIVLILLSVIFIIGVITIQKTLEITEDPSFCGKNCHIMRPYYNSWKTSSHNDVRCVECHYEPGLVGHIKGKINGLMQLYSYQTGKEEEYQPRAEVKNENCLKCHEKRIVLNATYKGVTFSHQNHLSVRKRGIQLDCTSCHSMIVIGMKEHRSVTDPSCIRCHPKMKLKDEGHLVVTTSTCFTCHFRDMPNQTSISGCPSCHGAPSGDVNYTGIRFKHGIHVSVQNYTCLTCHQNITKGADRIVSEDKCFQCHNVPSRLERYNDFQFIHDTHVTEHSIACYRCHGRVEHKPTVKQNLCADCHRHPANWVMNHGKRLLEPSDQICGSCHVATYCKKCHALSLTQRYMNTTNTEEEVASHV